MVDQFDPLKMIDEKVAIFKEQVKAIAEKHNKAELVVDKFEEDFVIDYDFDELYQAIPESREKALKEIMPDFFNEIEDSLLNWENG